MHNKYFKIAGFLSVVILSFCYPGFGQTFRGVVSNERTHEILPYANIGVKGKSVGGIADASGKFAIDLSGVELKDTLVVSYLGYRSARFTKSSIKGENHQISLEPDPIQLNEVVAKGQREILIIGNNKSSSNYTGWGDYVSSRGRLRGLAMEPAVTPIQLSRFKMRLRHQEFDSVRIRLHILPLGVDRMPGGAPLLQENIFITCKKNQKWVELDLRPYNLIVSSGIIVAVEWVDAWFGEKTVMGDSKRFTIGTTKQEGYAYERKTPEEPMSFTRMSYTPTMYFEVFETAGAVK